MIKSNELRLGNWVLLDWENTYRRVNLNTLCYITRSEKLGKKHPFKPIPLTEEILLKCGFVYIESKNVYKLYLPNDNQLLIGFNFQNELRLYYKVFNIDLVEIKHLNQLQNLYFALTNEELTITL